MTHPYRSETELHARRADRRRRTRRRRGAGLALVALIGVIGLVIAESSSGTRHRLQPRSHATLRQVTVPHRAANQLALADKTIAGVLGYTSYVAVGAGHRRDVALTFDDGPGPSTPKVLAILRRYRV